MRWALVITGVCLFAWPVPAQDEFPADAGEPEVSAEPELPRVPSRLAEPPLGTARPLPIESDLLSFARRTSPGHLGIERDGGVELLTLNEPLQHQLVDLLKTYQTPWAAVVAIEPKTGRVLAMAEHSEVNPGLTGLCTRALYPAASIFKIVTAAALLEAQVPADEKVCIHGGLRTVTDTELLDGPRDARCLTLTEAMGASANVAFAKLTARYLDSHRLEATAKALRFNTAIAFPVPTEPSLAAIPADTHDLSLTGAGFGDVFLSPLHGAALAATVANGGLYRAPVLYERDVASARSEQAISPDIAATLARMMEETVSRGTARRTFHERGVSLPDAVGKTGSLADKRPFRDYTWFIGYAPRENPKVAVAAVVVNDPFWRIRATWLGREAMRLYLLSDVNKPAASPGQTPHGP